jgi:hypothetical protein
MFDSSITMLGDLTRNAEFEDEVYEICQGFPQRDVSVYQDTVVQKLDQLNDMDKFTFGQKFSMFYVALLGLESERFLTRLFPKQRQKDVVLVLRLKMLDKTEEEVRQYMYDILIRLIQWEWKDRSYMMVQMLHMPSYVTRPFTMRICLGFFHYDFDWVVGYVRYIAKHVMRTPVRELMRKMRLIRHDLAMFVQCVKSVMGEPVQPVVRDWRRWICSLAHFHKRALVCCGFEYCPKTPRPSQITAQEFFHRFVKNGRLG